MIDQLEPFSPGLTSVSEREAFKKRVTHIFPGETRLAGYHQSGCQRSGLEHGNEPYPSQIDKQHYPTSIGHQQLKHEQDTNHDWKHAPFEFYGTSDLGERVRGPHAGMGTCFSVSARMSDGLNSRKRVSGCKRNRRAITGSASSFISSGNS